MRSFPPASAPTPLCVGPPVPCPRCPRRPVREAGEPRGLGLLSPWSPARPATAEDDVRHAQVSLGRGPAAGSPGPTPGACRPPSAGAGAGTRGGGGEGAGSGWERSGSGGGRSSAPRLEVAAPVIQGAWIPLRQRVGAVGARRSEAPEPTCAGGDAAGAGPRPGEGLGDSGPEPELCRRDGLRGDSG